MDRLDALLKRFQVEARLFHSGLLCGSHDFDSAGGVGHLHLLRRGPLTIHHAHGRAIRVTEPSLALYPLPLDHRFACHPREGAELVCASVRFSGGADNPLVAALPPVTVIPLAAIDTLGPTVELLFAEAFGNSCGRVAAVNRLFEVVLIQVLRFAMGEGRTSVGMLAGLSDPALARSLVAMHEQPAHGWSLDELAQRAGMSRSRFAARFHEVVGTPPGAYLARWRVGVACDMLRRGAALKVVAAEVGYGSVPALSRAFKAVTRASPRDWKRSVEAAGQATAPSAS